jgi:hypothetical protein
VPVTVKTNDESGIIYLPTMEKTTMKTKRLYTRKSLPGILIACHKGAHYVSGEKSVFTSDDKVFIHGEKGDATVRLVSEDEKREEVWNLKGSYTGSATASEGEAKVAKKEATAKPKKENFIPNEANVERIKASLERVQAKAESA